ncbi:unnamed protein product, partial [Notodromas monacha]
MRFYKLHASRGLVEPISMIVPRKTDASYFHDDLYPETPGPTATLTANEWIEGKNASPLLISLKSGWKMPTNKPVVYKPSEKKLITSDLNNERKFLFISQETHPDYRSLDCRTPGKPSIAELEERTCATLRNGNHCDSMEVTSISNSSPKTIVASSSFDASSEKKCERLDASVNGSENMDSLTTTRSAKCGMESTPNSPSRPERLEVTSTPKPAKRNGASPPSVTPRRRSVTPVSSDNSPCPKLAKDMDGRPQQRHGVDSGTSTATPTTSEDEDEGRKFACSLEDVRRGGVTSGGGTLRQAPRRSQSVSWRRRSAPPRGPIVCEIIAALQRHSSFSASPSDRTSIVDGDSSRTSSDTEDTRIFRRSSLCRSEPHLPISYSADMAQEQELVQSGSVTLSDLSQHGQVQQDKQGGILSPGATRFHEIQKLWGDRTGSAPAAKKSGDVMSMSVDSLPMKEASSIGILRKGFQETESHHMNGAQENALGEIQEASVGELKSEIRTLKGALKEKDFKIHSL